MGAFIPRKQEERRQEIANRRHLEIETVNSNLRLLEELLDNFETNGATAEEMDLCKELAANCDKLRPNLERLASETDDKEDGLGTFPHSKDHAHYGVASRRLSLIWTSFDSSCCLV
jgi:ADP-ribosylation factor-binding protein GGA